jgi:predicted nucleic acid-binding protein
MYLVDTNVISDARKGNEPVTSWLRSTSPSSVHLSVITLGEIMRGIALKAKSDPRSAAHLTEWLGGLREEYAANILPITDRIAIEWGRIGAIRTRGDADGLIAATALVHELILVTRNTADFDDTGVTLINPWIE